MKKIYSLLIICCMAMAAKAQTCTPWYIYPAAGTYAMNHVRLTGSAGSINDTFTVPAGGYIDHTAAAPITIVAGLPFYGQVVYNATSYNTYKNQAWIDYDGDGVFATSEQVTAPFGNACASFDSASSFTLLTPGSVPAGTYRLRIRNADTYGCSLTGDMSPCDSSETDTATRYYYGSTVDYMVTVRDTTLCSGIPASDTITYTGPALLSYGVPFTVSVTPIASVGITYQWQSSTTSPTSGFTNIYGSTNSSYYVSSGIDATTWYRCVVSCSYSAMSVTDGALMAYASCIGTPAAGPITSSDTVACATGTIVLNGSASGLYGITYAWQWSPDGTAWTDITGATDGAYVFTGLSTPTYYRQIVTCATSGLSAASAARRIDTISVCPCSAGLAGGMAIHSGPDTVASGTAFTVTDSGATASYGYTYQWQSSTTSATGGFSSISGATNAVYACTGITGTTWFQCVVSCSLLGSVTSTTTVVYIVTPCTGTPAAGIAHTTLPVACDTAAFTLSSTGYSTTYGVSLQWASSPDGITWTDIPGATGDSYTTATGIAATTYYHSTATCSTSGLSASTAALTVTYSSICPCSTAPDAGSIVVSAATGACSAITLTDSTSASSIPGLAYQWLSSTTSITSGFASVAGATGASYTFTDPHTTMYLQCIVGCTYSGAYSTTTATTVNGNEIYGHITFPAATPADMTTKVWLIYHDFTAGTLTAVDSQIACMDGGAPFFRFDGQPAGEYRIKAKLLMDSIPGVSAYIPTYGYSSPYWDTATLITHVAADSLHVRMVYGTVPAGRGFIGGSIAMGAGKHTTGDVPAAGMLVYLRDNATNAILTWQVTDASGVYAFSGLGDGAYNIYPVDLAYTTTPSAPIILSASSESSTGINFKEHTTAMTITPVSTTGVATVAATVVSIYPNPAAGSVNILWTGQPVSKAAVAVTDITGREVYKTTVNINVSSGTAAINIASLQEGIYFISIKSAGINFSSKLLIQQ